MSSVEALERRIAALEVGAKYDATKDEVSKLQMEFLDKLKEIRAQVIAEQNQGTKSSSTEELERLREENAKLKQQNEKLAYRVKHVVASLNSLLDEKNEQTK